MARVLLPLGTLLLMAVAWIVLWPVSAAGCLPTDGALSCGIGARSLAGLDLGVPVGDAQVAILVLTVIAGAGGLIGLRTAPRDVRLTRLAVGSLALGVALAVAMVIAIGVGGMPANITIAADVAAAVLIGAGTTGLVAITAARRGTLSRSLLILGALGTILFGLAAWLGHIDFSSRTATYIPLEPGQIYFSWSTVSTFVLAPTLGSTALALLVGAIVGSIAHTRRRAPQEA